VGGGQTGNPQAPSVEIDQNVDGNGSSAKRVETKRTETLVNGGPQTTVTTTVTTTYYVRSSLAGGDIALELDGQGNKVKGYIYALGGRLAEHWTSLNGVLWRHTNPVTGTMLKGAERSEFDPLGAEVGNYDLWVNDPTPTYQELKGSEPLYIEGGDPFNARSGCTIEVDGFPRPCSEVQRMSNSGALGGQLVVNGINIGDPRGVSSFLGGGYYIPGTASGITFKDETGKEIWATDPMSILDRGVFVRIPGQPSGIGAGFGLTGGQQDVNATSIVSQRISTSSCADFATFLDLAAEMAGGDIQKFMKTLVSSIITNVPDPAFDSSGFNPKFGIGTDNVVYHFVGGLTVAYVAGSTAFPEFLQTTLAYKIMDSHEENENSTSGPGGFPLPNIFRPRINNIGTPEYFRDINVNTHSIPLGVGLGRGKHTPQFVAGHFRKAFCLP